MDEGIKDGFDATNIQLKAALTRIEALENKPREHMQTWNGRYRVENGEVNGFNSNYGPGYGNNSSDLGDYPLNFTTIPSSLHQGWRVPWPAKINEIDFWWRTNNSNIVFRWLLWKQQKVNDSTVENNDLLWESADINGISGRSYQTILTAADLGNPEIADDEIYAISVATITPDASVRYSYSMGGRIMLEENLA